MTSSTRFLALQYQNKASIKSPLQLIIANDKNLVKSYAESLDWLDSIIEEFGQIQEQKHILSELWVSIAEI